MSIENECSRTGRENKHLTEKIIRFLVKIRTGIAATYKFSDGLRWSNTLRGLLVFSTVLITNTSNKVKFTTPISEEEVSVSTDICFKGGALWGPLVTRNGGTNQFRI